MAVGDVYLYYVCGHSVRVFSVYNCVPALEVMVVPGVISTRLRPTVYLLPAEQHWFDYRGKSLDS